MMKNKKHHILSILLIIFMLLMAVSTTRAPERIKKSISYETRGEYFLFKIKTRKNPNKYAKLDSLFYHSNFEISFDNREEKQIFRIDESGKIISELYSSYESENWQIIERININEEDCNTFTENEYFIIRIKNELLKYENPRLSYIYLYTNDGEYIHEIYLE
jgi:hypothetical protein